MKKKQMKKVVVDYTKRKAGLLTEDGVIQVCPKCGRNGIIHTYKKDNRIMIAHKKDMIVGTIFDMWSIFDSCWHTPED